MNLIVIGEAAQSVSAETRDANPDINWRGLRGRRNQIAHGYSVINHSDVWAAIQTHLPGLQTRLATLVEEIDARP